jgi:uncharacterized membrane protein HdeD (DUF308 family)
MSLPVTESPAVSLHEERVRLRRQWGFFFVLGLVSVIVGFLAIGSPHIATDKFVVIIGILLLIAGFTEVIHAVMVRNLRGFAMHLLAAALYLLVGLFVIEDPDRAAVVLTLLLAASFLVGGVLRIVFSLVEHFPAWSWVLLNGVVDLMLGVFILNRWPASGDWVIGLFIGIDLLFHGWSWIILGLTVRTYNAEQSA